MFFNISHIPLKKESHASLERAEKIMTELSFSGKAMQMVAMQTIKCHADGDFLH